MHGDVYSRYRGDTTILKIGMSKGNLRKELLNHLNRHHAADRIKRLQYEEDIEVLFSFVVSEAADVREIEGELLKEFEDKHIDLPLLNRQGGIPRG